MGETQANLEAWIVELTQGKSELNPSMRFACMLDVLKYVEDSIVDVSPTLATRLLEMRRTLFMNIKYEPLDTE